MFGRMLGFMMGCGLGVKCMERENSVGQTGTYMKEIITMTKGRVWELIYGKFSLKIIYNA